MAGLPQDRPIPGAPLLDPLGTPAELAAPVPIAPVPPGAPLMPQLPDVDPLTGLPAAAPPAESQGYQYDAQGAPLWPPPDSWFGTPEGLPEQHQGHDVPVVENEQAPPTAPAQEPPATTQAGAAALAAHEQARREGDIGHAYPEAAPRPSTGDAYLDNLAESGDVRARAAVAEGEAQKQKNLYLSEEGTRIAQDRSARQAAADNEYRQVYNEARARRAELDQEAKNLANAKIDPGRLWHDASFGAKLFVGITAALTGATTRAVQTGQNPVLTQINAMVERDLQAQQAQLDNRYKSLGVRRGLMADDLAAGRDMLDVQYKSLSAAYETAANQMQAYALRFDNPVIDARLATHLADIRDAQMELGTKYQQGKEQQLYARRQDQIHNAQAGRGLDIQAYNAETGRLNMLSEAEARANKQPSVRDQVLMSKEQREQQKYHDERVIPGARAKKGGELLVLDDKQAGPLRDKMATITSMSQKLDELEGIYEKHGWNPLGKWNLMDHAAAEDAKRAKVILGTILPEFSKANEQGVIRDKEYPMYFEMFGDPTALLDPRANISKMREMGIRGMNNELRAKSPNQDVAYWEPERAPSGNQSTSTTSDFAQKQKQNGARRDDQAAPRSSWEIVGQSPDGSKSLTAGGVVIPAGRQIVGQSARTGAGGQSVSTYELDDGSSLDIEE